MAILVNKTRQLEVLRKVETAETFIARLKGLLGRESLESGSGLLIKPCNSIHCFFMKFPIDVAFVDKDLKVIRVIPGMKPFSASPIVLGAKFVIETNAGDLNGKLQQDDIVEIV